LLFFLREEIERNPIEITTVARANKLKPNTLEKQYKKVLSGYSEFKEKKQKTDRGRILCLQGKLFRRYGNR